MFTLCPDHSKQNATTNACEGVCSEFPGVAKDGSPGVCRQPTKAECDKNLALPRNLCPLGSGGSCPTGVFNPATKRCNALCKDVGAFWKPVNATEICEPWSSADCKTYLNTFITGLPVEAMWARDGCIFTECPKDAFFKLDLPEPIGVVHCRDECTKNADVLHAVDITGLCKHVPSLDKQLCSAVTAVNIRWPLSCTSVVPPTLDTPQVLGVTSTPELSVIIVSAVSLLCLLLCVSVACFLCRRRYRDDSDSDLSDEEYGRKRSRRRGRRGRNRDSGSFCGTPCVLALCCTLLIGAVAAALAWRKALGTPVFAGVCGGTFALGCVVSAAWHWQRTRRARQRRQERARKGEEKEERRRQQRRRARRSRYHDDDAADGYGSTESEYDAVPRRAHAYAASSQSCSSEDRRCSDDEPRRGRGAASAGRTRHSGRSRSAEARTWHTRRARTSSSSNRRAAATAPPPRGASRRSEEDGSTPVRTAPVLPAAAAARTKHGTPEHAVYAQPTASPLHPGFYDDSESRAKAARKAAKRAAAAARSEAQRAANGGRRTAAGPPAHFVQEMGGLG